MKNSRTVVIGIASFIGLLFLRQQCYAAADAPTPDEANATIDWIAEMQKGGATGIALVVTAAVGILFFFERLINLRKSYILGSTQTIQDAIELGAEKNANQAAELYQSKPSTFTKVISHMAEYSDETPAEVMISASDIAARDLESHRRRNYGLGVVSTIAPLLGLLGTMVGMIEAFAKFSKLTDSSEAALVLGDSIGKALITTAVGLIIAIAALAAFHFFKVRLGAISDQLEADLDTVHHKWFRKSAK